MELARRVMRDAISAENNIIKSYEISPTNESHLQRFQYLQLARERLSREYLGKLHIFIMNITRSAEMNSKNIFER